MNKFLRVNYGISFTILLIIFCTVSVLTDEKKEEKKEGKKPTEVSHRSPPFSSGIFPCSDCHDGQPVNYKRRDLKEEHTNIIFEHDSQHRWCLDCHNPTNRDFLRLASGNLVPFSESYNLCGQCHGPTLRDWKLGIHGKRTGSWNGDKTYFLCVHCHNPHSPKIKPLEPFPSPIPPAGKAFFK